MSHLVNYITSPGVTIPKDNIVCVYHGSGLLFKGNPFGTELLELPRVGIAMSLAWLIIVFVIGCEMHVLLSGPIVDEVSSLWDSF